VTLASGDPQDVREGTLPLNADARVRVALLRGGTPVQQILPRLGLAYLVTDQWTLDLRSIRLVPRDGAAIYEEIQLKLTAQSDADVVIVELLQGI
jgi:quercetin 2,3-dioxygenase